MIRVKILTKKITDNTELTSGFSVADNGEYLYLVKSKSKKNQVYIYFYVDNNISYHEIKIDDYYLNLDTKEIFKAHQETDFQSLRENKFTFALIIGSTNPELNLILNEYNISDLEFIDINNSILSYDPDSDNPIKILKNNYTRDEMFNIAMNLLANYNVNKLLGNKFSPEEWLENNL